MVGQTTVSSDRFERPVDLRVCGQSAIGVGLDMCAMEIAAGLLELKEGTEKSVATWRDTLASRRDEVMQSLRNEGVETESWFEVEISGKRFLLWYMRTQSMDKALETFKNSTDDIDIFHRETLGSTAREAIVADLLLDFHEGNSKY